LIDKAKDEKQICREEIEEEVGFEVPLDSIHELASTVSSAGRACTQSLRYPWSSLKQVGL